MYFYYHSISYSQHGKPLSLNKWLHSLIHVMTYTNAIPQFTAEATLLRSKSAREYFTCNLGGYHMEKTNLVTMATNHIDPKTWCNYCEPCDPLTHMQSCEWWSEERQECLGTYRT